MIILTNPPYSPVLLPQRRPSVTYRYAVELGKRFDAMTGNRLGIIPEWHCFTSAELHNGGLLPYAPILDLAIGPYATARSCAEEYGQLLAEHRMLIENLLAIYRQNLSEAQSAFPAPSFQELGAANSNPRCFIAVEIERGNTNAKHLFASATYASVWGKVGIVVCWNEKRLRQLLRISEMIYTVNEYGKNIHRPANVVILSRDQIETILT